MSRATYSPTAKEVAWDYVVPHMGSVGKGGIYTYFIGEEEEGPVKIGYAENPVKRLRALQTGNPRRLRIERIVWGGQEVEALFHQYWATWRERGEWFCGERREEMLQVAEKVMARQRWALDRLVDGGQVEKADESARHVLAQLYTLRVAETSRLLRR